MPTSDLSGEVAAIQETVDADETVLHVFDEGAAAQGREFLRDWAARPNDPGVKLWDRLFGR